jgi:hypothetical protein
MRVDYNECEEGNHPLSRCVNSAHVRDIDGLN